MSDKDTVEIQGTVSNSELIEPLGTSKPVVYMVCDYTDNKASQISGTPNVGVEYMGDCGGRILHEDGTEIGRHHSSSFGWLRSDLKCKLDDPTQYVIIDLIGRPVPDKFKST